MKKRLFDKSLTTIEEFRKNAESSQFHKTLARKLMEDVENLKSQCDLYKKVLEKIIEADPDCLMWSSVWAREALSIADEFYKTKE